MADSRSNWLEDQFRNTHVIILVLFALCCGYIALIFGILGVIMCKDEIAKRNALIVLVISGVHIGLSVLGVFRQAILGH